MTERDVSRSNGRLYIFE